MKVFSFDVFDTCLARLCGEPRLLFDVLSLKIQKTIGDNCNEHMRQLFVASRINAGGRNLEEIYRHVLETFPIPYTVEQMAELEMETEREMLVPIVATRELIDSLRKKGKVLFISDMYLPAWFIQERLSTFGFFQEEDRIYVSDELGAWKHDGSLYRLVHEKGGVPYRHWHHYGDNRQSDVKVPSRLGIHAHHLHYDYLPYEEQWRQKLVLQYQYPFVLAGAARAVRLSSDASEEQKAFVCNISAPLMVSWVLHILTDAQQRGIRRLYFCARDVHTEYLIAKRLSHNFPEIDVRYLYISRVALYESPLIYDFLQQEGMDGTVPTAIVDSATSGKTLHAINILLKEHNQPPVYGYFLQSTSDYSCFEYHAEDANYLINPAYLDTIPMPMLHKYGGMTNFYEPFFSFNLHATTIGYEYHKDIIRPIFGSNSTRDDSWGCIKNNFRKIKTANDTIALAMTDAICATKLDSFYWDILTQMALPTLAKFINTPFKLYLKHLTCFFWWGKPFVGTLFGRGKGVWKRGNIFYSLPGFIISPLRAILSDDKKRRRINQMIIWKGRN